jgi:hypothetical protein
LGHRCFTCSHGLRSSCTTSALRDSFHRSSTCFRGIGIRRLSPEIRALSWSQIRKIVALFGNLNPYDRAAVPDSILKIEDDNFDPIIGKQRQLWCYAISAKRYALFLRDRSGRPTLLQKGMNNGDDRWSEHGLGHLLNPTDPNSEDRDWIAQVWLRIIRKALGLRSAAPAFENLPGIGRTSVSSPWVMRSLAALNRGKHYAKQIKPFNFLLAAHVRPFGHPLGVDPERFHLIAPFESNPSKWLMQPWIDVYSTKRYRVTTSQTRGPKVAGLQTYGDVLREYEHHEELKCIGPDSKPCARPTVGLLGRRHVRIAILHFIGKESNLLEEVEEATVHDLQSVYTEYRDPGREREAWDKIVSKLGSMSQRERRELAKKAGVSPTTIEYARRGRVPHPKNRAKLLRVLERT